MVILYIWYVLEQVATSIVDQLVDVCHHKTTDQHLRHGLTVSKHFPKLQRLVRNHHGELPVLVPSQAALVRALDPP